VNTAVTSPVVFPHRRGDYGPPPLTPAEIIAIHDLLAPVTAVMAADGMIGGEFAVTVGPHGLGVSLPERVVDHLAQAKLKFARDFLRGKLTAAGTIWQVPAGTLLCLLQPSLGYPGTYEGLAAALFDDSQPGNLIHNHSHENAHVEALPFLGTD
jgi:hypothetical protein